MLRSMSVPSAVSSLSLLGTFEVLKLSSENLCEHKLIVVPQESVLNGRLEPLGVVEVCIM